MALESQKVVSKIKNRENGQKKKFQYLFFLFFFNFHILLILKCFWKYLLKVRQVKNRQFRKQYARTQLEKIGEDGTTQNRRFFLEKIILCASCIPIKCAPSKLLVIFVHLRSFTTVLVRFYRKKYRGTRKVHGVRVKYTLFFTVRCVVFGLRAVYMFQLN